MAVSPPLLLLLLSLAPPLLTSSYQSGVAYGDESQFVSPPPQSSIVTEGGGVWLWSKDLLALQDANLSAAYVSVEAHSLALPMYSNAGELSYVIKGSAYVGLVTPLGIPTPVRFLTAGDVLVLPRGWASWVWNNAEESFNWIGVANLERGTRGRQYTPFELAGREAQQAQESGGILNGFSKELLAKVWDVDASAVGTLVGSQNGVMFVKVKENSDTDLHQALADVTATSEVVTGSSFPAKFKASLATEEPDWEVASAGRLWSATAASLPALWGVGLSATKFTLWPRAMLAPHWHTEGLVLLLVLGGSGRIEVAYPGGSPALRKEDLKKDDFIAIPRNYPTSVVAGEGGLEWIGIVADPDPSFSFFAGRNSVFKGVPLNILSAAFGVSADVESRFYSKRRGEDELVFFRPRG